MPVDRPSATSLLTRRTWAIAMLGLPLAAAAGTDDDSVTLEAARQELEAGRATLIDVREPQEHATGVARGARLLPMRQVGARLGEIPSDPKSPVLLICNTQNRSSATMKMLRANGFNNVRFVQGGMSEWVRRGWPVVPPGR